MVTLLNIVGNITVMLFSIYKSIYIKKLFLLILYFLTYYINSEVDVFRVNLPLIYHRRGILLFFKRIDDNIVLYVLIKTKSYFPYLIGVTRVLLLCQRH